MNKKISNILKEISDYLELKGENVFKVRAYRDASRIIENLDFEIKNLEDLKNLKGIPKIGKSIIGRVEEILKEGESLYLNELKKEYPIELEELLSIPGLGIKKIRLFYENLNIKNIEDLKDALYSGALYHLPRIGEKLIEKIKRGVEFREKNRGLPFPALFDVIGELTKRFKDHHLSYYITGELRRKKEFVKNLDFVFYDIRDLDVLSDIINIENIDESLYYKKISYTFENLSGSIYIPSSGLLWNVLFFTTGSKSHVMEVIDKYKKTNISFWKERFKREKDIYEKIEIDVIPPIFREGFGEFKWYNPAFVISKKDILGEFHVHSTWSDGRSEIEEILYEAANRGYEYIGISDHSASLTIAHGLSIEDVEKKGREIEELRDKNPIVYPLFGAEVDIRADGSLDYPDEVLKSFDYVIAAIHTNFGLSIEENTRRIISAFRNPYVIAFAHPTGRELGIRPGYEFDREEVFKEAARNNILLEINGTPRRMDLDSYEIYKLRSLGLKYILSSDAHYVSSLSNIENSLVIANKAGLEREEVVNTYKLKDVFLLFNTIREGKIRNE